MTETKELKPTAWRWSDPIMGTTIFTRDPRHAAANDAEPLYDAAAILAAEQRGAEREREAAYKRVLVATDLMAEGNIGLSISQLVTLAAAIRKP